MPSLIQGYEYDIFISYRQKDNKGDHWVTEFVNALKTELESTFKEDISIYFDENPHDGLHEHHDVDDSLRDKLKCLVFIPIVSRTYCDPNSFAWVQEFKAFLAQASKDSYGLKVKLPNGNVASRVLPVRIHELESDDLKLIESEMQAVLRPIDFVFKSSGVNRPLLPADKKEENTNHTFYRDQINKVANAINEIISSLKKSKGSPEKSNTEIPIPVEAKSTDKKSNRSKILVGAATLILLLTAAYFFINRPVRLKDPSTSGVAILPFRNNTGSEELNYYGVGIASDIRTKLSMSKQFSFISSLQATLPYINTSKSTKEIGSELGVDFILSGLYQKVGNKIKVDAELVDAENGKVVWTLPFEKELNDILQVQAEIADDVLSRFARKMEANTVTKTTSLEAYAHYTRGYELFYTSDDSTFSSTFSSAAAACQPAIVQFEKAIALDSGYVDAWVGLVDVQGFVLVQVPNDTARERKISSYVNYFYSHFPATWQRNLVEGIYNYRVSHKYDVALIALEKVLEKDPQNIQAISTISYIYKRHFDFAKAIAFKKQMALLDPSHGNHWRDLGATLSLMGDIKNGYKASLKAWDLSHSKEDARIVLYRALDLGLPLDQLPQDAIKKLGSEYDLVKQIAGRNWSKVIRIGLKRNDYVMVSWAYYLLNKQDSVKYWAKKGIAHGEDYTLYAAIGDHQKAFDRIDKMFSRLIDTGDDKMILCEKMSSEINAHILLYEYKEATEELTKMNNDYPDYGDFDWFYTPLYDKIRKDYPPFQKALDNLKRKPILDVNEYIKM